MMMTMMRTVATADEDYDDDDDEDADDDDNDDDAVYEGADAGSGDGDGDCDDDDVYVDDDVMMTTMMMAMMMMTIMMTMLMMRMMMTMMTMMMTMTMMTIMLMLMVMMTTAPQAADSQTISNLEECGNSLKEILARMSASDFIRAFGLQGGEQGEGFAQAIHVLERLAQKESAPQRGTALQTALPRHEQCEHPAEVNISAYQACSSSLGR